MEKLSEKEAIRLLRKYASSEKDFDGVLKHSKAVQKLAIEIGKKVFGEPRRGRLLARRGRGYLLGPGI